MSEKPTNPKDAIGIKKAPLSTVPMNVVAEMGVGMLEGASKYGRHNYRGVGVRASVYFDATMRHLIAWFEGEDIDPDTVELDEFEQPIPGTGVSHIAKALCSLAVLRDAQMQGMCTDDRPPRSKPFYPALNKRSAGLIEKHADKHPKHWTIDDSDAEPDAGQESLTNLGCFRGGPTDAMLQNLIRDGFSGQLVQARDVTLGDYIKRIDGEGSSSVD